MRKSLLIFGFVLISGCSSLPDISVIDDLGDSETKELVSESVWVVDAKDARRFSDPSWPAPIQIVSPMIDGGALKGSYDVKLFDAPPTGQRIDVVYVIDGDQGECVNILSKLGVSASQAAWVEVNSGGESLIRCASVIVNTPDGLSIQNPFITDYRKVELASMRESVAETRYPIKIIYLHD